jgi:hypothetical protein
MCLIYFPPPGQEAKGGLPLHLYGAGAGGARQETALPEHESGRAAELPPGTQLHGGVAADHNGAGRARTRDLQTLGHY